MLLEVNELKEAILAPMPEPVLTISRSEVERRTGLSGGPSVLSLRVLNEDGTVARFFLSVAIRNGRAKAILTGQVNSEKEDTTKSVVADWRL